MAKKRKKQSFAERHPFITLATLPVSLPAIIATDIVSDSKKSKKKSAAKPQKTVRTIRGQSDGHSFEHYVADRLRRSGYRNVRVTRGSGDYGADVIATKGRVTYSIQCKYYSKAVGVEAVQQALSGMMYYHCNGAMVITNAYFTPQAKRMAQETGTVLWDNFR